MPIASYPPRARSSLPPVDRFPVIVFEDDPLLRDRAAVALREVGYEVEEVVSTEGAVEAARCLRPFMIVVNRGSGETTGLDLLERLRRTRDDFEAILITSSTEMGALLRSAELHLFRCIPRPFAANELVSAVAGAARRLALRQALVDSKRELEEHNAQLRAELRLEESRRLLSERLASVGQFAAALTHEINNPLAYVHSNIEVLRFHVGDVVRAFQALASGEPWSKLPDDQRQVVTHYMLELESALDDCAGGLDMIRGISKDLSTVARYRSDAAEVFDANDVVRTATRIATIGQKDNVRVCLELAEGRAWMPGGPGTIAQVVMNLLANAIHATDYAAGRPNLVTVRTSIHDAEVWIEVSDTGQGIPEDRLGTIFDLFVTHSEGGTGLGLGLVRQIMSEHDGTIDVESTVGVGTTFRARFPASPEEAPASKITIDRALPRGLRVLFVDDDARLRRLYGRLFPEQEAIVVACTKDALRVIAEQSIDCIVCDLYMPHEDGLTLFARVRAEAPDLLSLFVFVTGTDSMLARARAEAPNVPLVRKPFAIADLRHAILRTQGDRRQPVSRRGTQ